MQEIIDLEKYKSEVSENGFTIRVLLKTKNPIKYLADNCIV